MKRSSIYIIVLIQLFFFSCDNSKLKDGDYEIEVYVTNDIHGRYFDSLYNGNSIHNYSLAKVSAYIKERRSSRGNENIVLLDAGDNLQGDNCVFY